MLSLAGCAGEDSERAAARGPAPPSPVTTTVPEAGIPGWVKDALAELTGPDVVLVLGTSDFAKGVNRVTFLVVRKNGSLVQTPTARLRYGAEDGTARGETVAELVPLGPHSHPSDAEPHDHREVTDLYVASIEARRPGRYWLIAEPYGKQIQGVGSIDVRAETRSISIGSKAPPSDTPTLANAPANEVTTARPPDVDLLRHSVAESLEDGAPFVLAFATPKYCESRTCGPTVEVVQKVRQQFEGTGIRFLHVEVYEGNDPAKGYNRWMREWNLPSEPWVLLVDGSGIVRAKFEGSVSVDELGEAVEEHLQAGDAGR
jgi:hypothetical protein